MSETYEISDLPDETADEIFLRLGYFDSRNLARSSKRFHELYMENIEGRKTEFIDLQKELFIRTLTIYFFLMRNDPRLRQRFIWVKFPEFDRYIEYINFQALFNFDNLIYPIREQLEILSSEATSYNDLFLKLERFNFGSYRDYFTCAVTIKWRNRDEYPGFKRPKPDQYFLDHYGIENFNITIKNLKEIIPNTYKFRIADAKPSFFEIKENIEREIS